MTIHGNELRIKLDELFERSVKKVISEIEEELLSVLREYSHHRVQEMLLHAGIKQSVTAGGKSTSTQSAETDDSLETKLSFELSNAQAEAVEKENLQELNELQELNNLKERIEELEEVKEENCKQDIENQSKSDRVVDRVQSIDNTEGPWYGLALVPEGISLGQIQGMENSNCHSATYRRLSMVICQVSEMEYGQDSLHQNLSNLLWVEERARKHERIQVSILSLANRLLPLPFCTMYSSLELVESKLRTNYEPLMEELDRIGNFREINLKLHVNLEKLRTRLIKQKTFQGSQGGKDYFRKKQWEQTIKKEIEQFLEDKSAAFIEKLKPIIEEMLILEHNDTEQTGMITCFNSCFLLQPEKLDSWENEISLFDQETDEWGFVLDISGPWPPFHFVKLQGDGFIESSNH